VIGQQVAKVRKFRGWTQRELADFAGVSHSLLTKVESGHVPASQAFVAACARALRVRVEELTGQPYRGDTAAGDRADAGVAGLRAVLWEHDPVDPDGAGRPLAELRPVLAGVERLRRAARYVEMVEALPGLIRELLAATTTTSGFAREQVFGALAGAYSAAQTATRFLGYADVAALCVERMFWAAHRSGDPLWRAVATEKRGHLQLLAGAYDAGLRATAAALEELAGEDRPAALAVAGTLHLRAGILAARAARADRARAELGAAAEYADRLPSGEPEDWYGLAFGTPNVLIHQVAAEVELGEGARAVALAARLGDPTGRIEASRVGHHYIDLARGQMLHGDRNAALEALQAARRAAPQKTRHDPMVRETLDVLVRARRVPEELREFATWVGYPPLESPR